MTHKSKITPLVKIDVHLRKLSPK